MDSITDVPALVARGNDLLYKGEYAEAAQDYARATQLDSANPAAHLGVAQANLALGSYGIASVAASKARELAPDTVDGLIAQAILYLLDRRYDAALPELERADALAPGRPYIHAMRGYCLRRMGNSYDAQLAESKAARLAGQRGLTNLFPPIEKAAAPSVVATAGAPDPGPGAAQRITYGEQRDWNRTSGLQRQLVRSGIWTSRSLVTTTLVIINIAIYLIEAVLGRDFINPVSAGYFVDRATGALVGAPNALFGFGAEQGILIQQDPLQAYRILTAMFLHLSIFHIVINMISLWSVGIITEVLFGRGRFIAIYFLAGIAGGVAQAVLEPSTVSAGASGAIFGIFGAFGAFALMRRRQLGPAGNAVVGQWFFFLLLNAYISFSDPNIGKWDHVGGLIIGFALGAFFVSRSSTRRA